MIQYMGQIFELNWPVTLVRYEWITLSCRQSGSFFFAAQQPWHSLFNFPGFPPQIVSHQGMDAPHYGRLRRSNCLSNHLCRTLLGRRPIRFKFTHVLEHWNASSAKEIDNGSHLPVAGIGLTFLVPNNGAIPSSSIDLDSIANYDPTRFGWSTLC